MKQQETIIRSDELDEYEEEVFIVMTKKEMYASPEWMELRKKVIDERGQYCEECKVYQNRKHLRLHHLDDDNGFYDIQNVKLVCSTCHKKMHQDVEFFG